MELHRADEFGNEEVDVGIALAMAMGAHVGGHAVDGDGDVAAVVEVEAAQEVLVGFSLAGMLRDDEAGHGFQHLAGAGDRPVVEGLAGNDARA